MTKKKQNVDNLKETLFYQANFETFKDKTHNEPLFRTHTFNINNNNSETIIKNSLQDHNELNHLSKKLDSLENKIIEKNIMFVIF